MGNIVIGIEGLVGSGKTSICRELLKYIPNSIILHGGNLYRGIVYALMSNSSKIDLAHLKANIQNADIKNIMDKLKINIEIENRESVVCVDGVEMNEEALQSEKNSIAVSIAGANAQNEKLYQFAHQLIDKYKEKANIIVSGRDLMKIYPELDYHFFITASLEERIKRKMIQYGENSDYEDIKKNIVARDKIQQEAGYYTIYANTIQIDVTDCRSANESAKKVLKNLNL